MRKSIRAVNVIVINSLSYTGTSWINCLFGCHDRSFALGPPDRVVNLHPKGWEDACRVHGPQCSLWPVLYEKYNPNDNFYIQLAAFTDKNYIIINNPIPNKKAEKDLSHPDIIVKHIRVVRDGRAVCRSYLRNHAGADFYSTVKDWFLPSAQFFDFDDQDEDVLCVRYEDVVGDQYSAIQKFGDFIGLAYPENFFRFWEFDHHIVAGNTYMYGMIRRFQQGVKFSGRRKSFYEREYERLKLEPEQPVFDEAWKTDLSRRELFVFDYFAGVINAYWGYTRDTFTSSEFGQFQSEMIEGNSSVSRQTERQQTPLWIWFQKVSTGLRIKELFTTHKLECTVALAAFYFFSIGFTALLVWWLTQ